MKREKYIHINAEAENKIEEKNLNECVDIFKEIVREQPNCNGASLMPDTCPTGEWDMPVGAVIGIEGAIVPNFTGNDICCSVMLSFLDKKEPKVVMDACERNTHFGILKRSQEVREKRLSKQLEEKFKSNPFLNYSKTLECAEWHIGTQGDGNHFLFVGKMKSSGETVMVTHHGSRGVGARLHKRGNAMARGMAKKILHNNFMAYNTEEGKAYWEALQIVKEWTVFNHTYIHDCVKRSLSIESYKEPIFNEHNFVFLDNGIFYHAKGATPLLQKYLRTSETKRLIPLNMKDGILIVEGGWTENNLGFTSHGAGRNLSRGDHRRSKEGDIKEIFKEETEGIDVRFSSEIDITELPSAYKNADMVRRQIQKFNLGEVIDEIIPYGCIMGGTNKR